MLGIIGAMDGEVAGIKDKMEGVSIQKKAGMEFFQGKLNGKNTVVVKSGIGKVNAAICAQILADDYKISALVNTGIAGSLQKEINIGDIVISEDAVQHDMDAGDFGYPKGQIPQMDVFSFRADKKLMELAKSASRLVNPEVGLHIGRVLSGDVFVCDKETKNSLTDTFHGCCVEMEGAAIAQAAYLNGLPFVIIRAISDKADDSASMDYPAFEKMAIERSVRLMIEMAGRYE